MSPTSAASEPSRVLLIGADLPGPVDNGGRIRIRQTLLALSERYSVRFIGIGPRFNLIAETRELLQQHTVGWQFHETRAGLVGRRGGPARLRYSRLLRTFLSAHPLLFQDYCDLAARSLVDRALGEFDPQAIVLSQLHVWPCLPKETVRHVPILLDEYNVESQLFQQQVVFAKQRWRQTIATVDGWKLGRAERHACTKATVVSAVSKPDARLLELMTGRKVHVVPNGVCLEDFPFAYPVITSAGRQRVLFLGSLGYFPNIDAVDFLLEEILPILRRARPNVELAIAGGNAPPSLAARVRQAGATFLGSVASAVDSYHGASVLIIPLRLGGGTRIKVLEALAAGTAVVSTPKGIEGLSEIRNGVHMLVGDSPADLADMIVTLLADHQLAASLALNGRELVEQHYTWHRSMQQLTSLVDACLLRTANPAAHARTR